MQHKCSQHDSETGQRVPHTCCLEELNVEELAIGLAWGAGSHNRAPRMAMSTTASMSSHLRLHQLGPPGVSQSVARFPLVTIRSLLAAL